MAANKAHSSLDAAEERAYIVDFFVMSPMVAMLALSMCIILRKDRKAMKAEANQNPYIKYAWRCAQIACTLASIQEFAKILLCNNLVIGWDYTASRNSFISMTDSIAVSVYIAIKLSFYYGFTFHLKSILYAQDEASPLSLCAKLLMAAVAVYMTVTAVALLAMDATTYSAEEIGISQRYNIYFTMIYSNSANSTNRLFCSGALLIDIVYFLVLFYLYISRASKTRNGKQKAMRGLLLAITSCVFFWIFLLSQIFHSPFSPILAVLDVVADIVCLFALFESGSLIYDNICGCSCAKLFASENYRELANQNETDDELVPEQDAAAV